MFGFLRFPSLFRSDVEQITHSFEQIFLDNPEAVLEWVHETHENRMRRVITDATKKSAALATLHTKAFIVDKRQVFIGSFNWDPRSVNINTELGVVIDSPEIANGILDSIETQRDSRAYEVILNDAGKIRWIDRSGESEIVLKKEPQTGFWRRFYVGFMRILPIKSQL